MLLRVYFVRGFSEHWMRSSSDSVTHTQPKVLADGVMTLFVSKSTSRMDGANNSLSIPTNTFTDSLFALNFTNSNPRLQKKAITSLAISCASFKLSDVSHQSVFTFAEPSQHMNKRV